VNSPKPVLIIDMGSGYIKFGPPNQSTPTTLPACLPKTTEVQGEQNFCSFDPGRADWIFPLENGLLPEDPSLLVQLCENALREFPNELAQQNELEILLLLFPKISPDDISAACKKIQESLQCKQVDTANQQILTWEYCAKRTALIIDIGYTITFVTPIFQGFLLDEHIQVLITGGFFVSAAIRRLLLRMGEEASSDERLIYNKLSADGEAINYIKKALCRILPKPEDLMDLIPKGLRYRDRDTDISIGHIPWEAPEVLFQPTLLGVGDKGIIDAIVEILDRVDSTVRAELAENIVLSGGGALIPGLKSRLQIILKEQMPYLSVKVFDLENPQYASWLGAARNVK
jgi:actin beta/gamma 1